MDIKELVELAKTTKLTEEDQAAFLNRLTDADKEFAKQEAARRPTKEFLNRTYSI